MIREYGLSSDAAPASQRRRRAGLLRGPPAPMPRAPIAHALPDRRRRIQSTAEHPERFLDLLEPVTWPDGRPTRALRPPQHGLKHVPHKSDQCHGTADLGDPAPPRHTRPLRTSPLTHSQPHRDKSRRAHPEMHTELHAYRSVYIFRDVTAVVNPGALARASNPHTLRANSPFPRPPCPRRIRARRSRGAGARPGRRRLSARAGIGRCAHT